METLQQQPSITLNEKWRPLFTSDSKYYLLTGGRGSGKTFAISYFALTLISIEAGHRVAVYRATMVSSEDSIMRDIKDMAQQLPNAHEFNIQGKRIVNTETGSEIFFKGIQTSRLDYTAAVKGLANCTTFILDEAEELTDEALWDKISDTFRTKHRQIRMLISLNPATREHWIYNRFIVENGWKENENGTKNNITYIHTTYNDNRKHIDQEKVKEWDRAAITRPDYYQHTILGGWRARAVGVVFTEWEILGNEWFWDQERGIYNPKDSNVNTRWLYERDGNDQIYGQDYGYYPDATTLVRVLIDRHNKILYVHECFYKHSLDTNDIAALNVHWAGKEDLIVADNAEARLINELQQHCNIIDCKKGPDSVTAGVQTLRDFKIVVTPESTNLIKELNNYVWDENKIDKPVKGKWDHCIDALRYAVMYEMLDSYADDAYVG